MQPKEAFFNQFPGGCPICGGPKRYITFSALLRKSKYLWGIADEYSHFAECQVCNEIRGPG